MLGESIGQGWRRWSCGRGENYASAWECAGDEGRGGGRSRRGHGLNTRGGFLVRGGEIQVSGKVLLIGGRRQRELGAAK